MKIQEILKQPEDKSLEFKKEIPKKQTEFIENSGCFCKRFRR